MLYLVIQIALLLCVSSISVADIPKNAKQYLPIFKSELMTIWPAMYQQGYYLTAQVEQETCITLTHSKCWSPHAELKTSREYGFGLGQLTITPKFNNFIVAKRKYENVKDWIWSDRYDPKYQLRTLINMDRSNYNALSMVPYHSQRLLMTFASYNGGLGGVLTERRLCSTKPNCDINYWYQNVELYSNKSRKTSSGYGKSFFSINREYVRNIDQVRSKKYVSYFRVTI